VLLPIANTTAELLAWWIGRELISTGKLKLGQQLEKIVVAVDENNGQWGECELDWS
jgi:6-pyruvoyltetrahydropterin/6-carboxytetrahydropterin synthase